MWIKILQTMNPQTQWFIEAILFFTAYFHIRFSADNAYKAPAFLTTLGILGTFVGIGVGLVEFNPNDIQNSVPMLINGIKTAVWASACGILGALSIKLRDILMQKKRPVGGKKTGGRGIDELIQVTKAVEQALVGNGESSLLQQLKLTRNETTAQLAELNRSLEGFCDNVAESNERALVKALNEIMRDFNTKLNEHMGDNFKQLNAAAEKMLVWQQHYSQQIGKVIDQQDSASKTMDTVSARYKLFVENADAFNTVAHSMSALLSGLEAQRGQIDMSMRSLATLINTASGGLPQIEKQIVEMTRQVTDGMRVTNDEFNVNMKKIIEKTKEQVVVLDAALSEELTKSLDSFGRQLASLSQKFAEDYTPITERLQAVLKIGG